MNITRTCKITLNAEELRAALTAYILEKNRYRYNHDAVKSYEEVLSIDTLHPECTTVVWGTAPKPEKVEPPPIEAIALALSEPEPSNPPSQGEIAAMPLSATQQTAQPSTKRTNYGP